MEEDEYAKAWRKGLLYGGIVCLFLIILIAYLALTKGDRVTPATASRASYSASSDYSGNMTSNVEFVDTTTVGQQKAAAKAASETHHNDSSGEGTLQVILLFCLLGGVAVYIVRGGRPLYLREPWQTF